MKSKTKPEMGNHTGFVSSFLTGWTFDLGLLPLDAPVGHVLDLVDADDPVLGGVGLLHHLQLVVLVPDLGVAHTVVARGLT